MGKKDRVIEINNSWSVGVRKGRGERRNQGRNILVRTYEMRTSIAWSSCGAKELRIRLTGLWVSLNHPSLSSRIEVRWCYMPW
jgi:hypothetical protein